MSESFVSSNMAPEGAGADSENKCGDRSSSLVLESSDRRSTRNMLNGDNSKRLERSDTAGNLYGRPTSEEQSSGHGLVGARISIYLQYEKKCYPCRVLKYIPDRQTYEVLYEEDDSQEVYEEDLRSTSWKVWRGTDAEYQAERARKVPMIAHALDLSYFYIIKNR